MHSKAGLTGALIAMTLISASCASARTASDAARLPHELHGVWEGGVEKCTLPGNPDSDSRIIISGRKVEGYEDWSEVLEVVGLSDNPLAWKVKTKLHIYEDTTEITEIFVVSGEDRGELTIVNERQSNRYERCR